MVKLLRGLPIAAALVVPTLAHSHDHLRGNVHKGTYGRGTYEAIPSDSVSVSSGRMFSRYTYDLTVTDLTSDNVVRCALVTHDDAILSWKSGNPGNDRTISLNFSITEKAAKFGCEQYVTNRQTRPNTGASDFRDR